ncbi:hypothetical protein [Mizugakiibacter sediminis]|nr:hypothetical protein [Mizugakiibacter sediminis]
MKRISRKLFRIAVIGAATLVLLAPGMVMAAAWTAANLVIALIAIVATIAAATWAPRIRWFSAIMASLLIAIPPYPYWLFSSNSRGWYLHFFDGFNVQNLPILGFALYFAMALFLFGAIFWAVRTPTQNQTA